MDGGGRRGTFRRGKGTAMWGLNVQTEQLLWASDMQNSEEGDES